jgi:hypothetical protein
MSKKRCCYCTANVVRELGNESCAACISAMQTAQDKFQEQVLSTTEIVNSRAYVVDQWSRRSVSVPAALDAVPQSVGVDTFITAVNYGRS